MRSFNIVRESSICLILSDRKNIPGGLLSLISGLSLLSVTFLVFMIIYDLFPDSNATAQVILNTIMGLGLFSVVIVGGGTILYAFNNLCVRGSWTIEKSGEAHQARIVRSVRILLWRKNSIILKEEIRSIELITIYLDELKYYAVHRLEVLLSSHDTGIVIASDKQPDILTTVPYVSKKLGEFLGIPPEIRTKGVTFHDKSRRFE